MGLASSQARLLSITARLTSNEYESQQISNAKMRLATQSQEASEAYIGALNDCEYAFISYDSTGSQVQSPLTVATMYEYADGKNQYILTNSAGKVLLSNADIKKYESSPNLETFLNQYGITRTFKSKRLEEIHNNLFNGTSSLSTYAKNWQDAIAGVSISDWGGQKQEAQSKYLNALSEYTSLVNRQRSGENISKNEIWDKQIAMETALNEFMQLVSQNSAKENQLMVSNPTLYANYQKYQEAVAQYQDELDELGVSANNAYKYDDPTKAQWYTNLWYRLNGPSTDNSGAKNYSSFNISDGIREAKDGQKILPDDTSLLNSSVWISNALSKGLVNIEQAAYTDQQMTLSDSENPFIYNLHGITWSGKIYSSISDIVQSNNDKKIAQAEAEYQRKTAEINAKDENYQRKLSLLDSEHNAIQTEYESVKSALNKNMERSFKAFQG